MRSTEPSSPQAPRDKVDAGFGVDRLAALPIEHRQDSLDPGVEIEGPGIATIQAVDRPLDGHRLQVHAPGPVLPALHRPGGRLGEPGFRAGILAQLPPEFPLDAGVDGRADGRGLLLLAIRGLDSSNRLASATAASTYSGSRAPGRERTSSMAVSKYRRSSLAYQGPRAGLAIMSGGRNRTAKSSGTIGSIRRSSGADSASRTSRRPRPPFGAGRPGTTMNASPSPLQGTPAEKLGALQPPRRAA
jgi:hypothetical protein